MFCGSRHALPPCKSVGKLSRPLLRKYHPLSFTLHYVLVKLTDLATASSLHRVSSVVKLARSITYAASELNELVLNIGQRTSSISGTRYLSILLGTNWAVMYQLVLSTILKYRVPEIELVPVTSRISIVLRSSSASRYCSHWKPALVASDLVTAYIFFFSSRSHVGIGAVGLHACRSGCLSIWATRERLVQCFGDYMLSARRMRSGYGGGGEGY